jgi:carboxypeptidase T
MKILLILVLAFGAFVPLLAQDVRTSDKTSDETPIVGRVTVKTDGEMQRVIALGLDLLEYREGDDLLFITTRTELTGLMLQGFQVTLDVQKTNELPVSGDTFGGGYRTVEETAAFIDQMHTQYPNLTQVFNYGQSWLKVQNVNQGYDLRAISLTNHNIPGPKPIFMLQGGIHAREWVTCELAQRFIQYLLSNYGTDADATWLLNEHEIIVLPMYNPDGRKIAETGQLKRKNENSTTGGCSQVNRGIDLNRNYSFHWGVVNGPGEPPCGETWPGLVPNSEPETTAVQNLLISKFPDQRAPDRNSPAPLNATGVFLDLHSTGNLVLYPWGEDTLPPPNMQLRTIARKAARYNGYNPIQTIQLYPTSGTSQDFGYGELGIAALGMETGNGSGSCGGFMPAYSCMDGGTGGNFWGLNRPTLVYFAKLARTPYMEGEGPVSDTFTCTRPTNGRNGIYNLRAQFNDNDQLATGQNIVAVEAYVGIPPWRAGAVPLPMQPEDGSFNSPIEWAVRTVRVGPGKHLVYVRAQDAAGNWGPIKAAFADDGSGGGDPRPGF